ncbi:MAG TPA: DUF2188 domain-containing protein [Casimicrobiaceae bacterium]|jgi:hypothetical protein|nr:DUF2188 domain-containing protein [Casimicrobiaceae bacterium]
MEQYIYAVQQRDDTRWHVYETGFTRSLASFGLKEDAIEYARDLAGSRSPGETELEVVEVKRRRERACA